MPDTLIDEVPFFTAAQRSLAAQVREFASNEQFSVAGESISDEAYRGIVSSLAEAGLLEYAVPRSGSRVDFRALCLVREALAYSSPLADLAFTMQGLGTHPISTGAVEHVRDFWTTRAREGKAIAGFALTEPNAGSDISGILTTAKREGESYVINGAKCFISNAGVADFYTVFARSGTRSSTGSPEFSAFVVGSRMAGFNVRQRTNLLSIHPIGELEFTDLRVPAEYRIGAEGEGLRLALGTLDGFRASVGAAACGMAERALDEALRYARTRKQFGEAIGEHQLVQAKLAQMATDLVAARLLVYRAAYLKDAGAERITLEASQAKLFATEAAFRIIDSALQIHGAAGLVRGSIMEQLYRDVRALRIYEGTSEIQQLIIARQLLDNP